MTTDPTDLVADILINDSCGCVGGGGGTATKILAALVEAGWRAPGDEDEAAPLDAGPVSPETLVLMHGTTRSGLPFNVEVDLAAAYALTPEGDTDG